jgi:serine O-acetyltransferase
MINSKEDYLFYLEADRIALGKPKYSLKVKFDEYIKLDLKWSFQRLLRKSEYFKNVKSKNSFRGKLAYYFIKRSFKKKSLKLGFSIPENVFGPGLAILHYGTIIVNAEAKVGSNCRLQACTNIGQSGGKMGAPIIGDNVYIGPGAKVYEDIQIASRIAIAANAAVGKSFLTSDKLIGGIPAKEITDIDIHKIIKTYK